MNPAQRLLRSVRLHVALWVVVSLSITAHAQQTVHAEKYVRTTWKVTDGLPENAVQALAEASDGSLWIGTTGGLAKAGGGRMRSPIQTPSVTCLALASDHTLWVGTEGDGLLHLVGRRSRIFSTADGLANGFVRAVFQDSTGQIWVGTDRGLFQRKGERLERLQLGSQSSDMEVRAITEDEQGRLWVAGSQLFSIDKKGHQTEYLLPSYRGERSITAMLQAHDGTLWIGMPRGLAVVENGRVHPKGNLHAPVRALLQANDGALWIGTAGDGLWTQKQGRFSRVLKAGTLPSESISTLLQDQFGQIWIGTPAGLTRLENSPLGLMPIPNATDRRSETVTGDSHGNIWVAAREVYEIEGRQIRQVDYGIPDVNVRTMLHARNGAVWLGTENDGAYRILRGHLKHFTAPAQLASNSIRAFMEARDGSLWIGTEAGITLVTGDATTLLREKDGLAYSSVRTFSEDADGTIWIGTDHGLSKWKNRTFVQDEATRTLSQDKVWSILQDKQGVLWFATRSHGLFRYRADTLLHYTTQQGLPTNSTYKFLQDSNGTFWVSGPNVIYSLQESEMDTTGLPASPLNPVLYAIPSDGVQMYGGQEPAGFLARDGTVWFPSTSGLVHVSTAKERSNVWAPQIASLSDEGYIEPLYSPSQSALKTGRVSYRLVAVYLRPQDSLRFRYKLDGVDPTWTQIKPDELLTYTNLQPGHYRLRIQAIDFATVGAVSEKAIDFYKAPRFYQAWWFFVLCAFGLLLIIWSLYFLHLRQVHLRFKAVLEERARLAREMHDTVIQSCTGLSVLLEAVDNAGANDQERRELLVYAKDLTSTTVNQARDAVWTLRHGEEKWVDLVLEVQGLVAQAGRDHEEIRIEAFTDKCIQIPGSAAHEILMVMREAVCNALQHSESSRIVLSCRRTRCELSIDIRDYGIGMTSNLSNGIEDGHYGIIGMQERMKRIGGRLELLSHPEGGTLVQIRVAGASGLNRLARTVEA